MERHEVLAMMTALKLAGMRAAYDDILADGLKRRHPVQQIAAWPTTVTRSRWPRALMRRTQNPLSALWNVTRSTRPARTSRFGASGCRTAVPLTTCRAY